MEHTAGTNRNGAKVARRNSAACAEIRPARETEHRHRTRIATMPTTQRTANQETTMTKREKTYTTTKQAMKQAVAIVRQHLPLIVGAKDGGYLEQTLTQALDRDSLHIAWERSWGVGCDLSISIRHGGLEREETRVVLHKRASVEVGWSSTGRSPTEATAAIALYTQVAQLACLVQAVLDRMDIADVETTKAAAK